MSEASADPKHLAENIAKAVHYAVDTCGEEDCEYIADVTPILAPFLVSLYEELARLRQLVGQLTEKVVAIREEDVRPLASAIVRLENGASDFNSAYRRDRIEAEIRTAGVRELPEEES